MYFCGLNFILGLSKLRSVSWKAKFAPVSMSDSQITILAIESSCDDTSAAVLQNGRVLSNVIANQTVHSTFGGVVPEIASRAHQQNIVPVVDAALQKAGITQAQLSAIAFTRGPGLVGSLLVGISFAKAMALALKIPLIEVDHMQAHVLAHFAEEPYPEFPFLCLTVSGGHTQIAVIRSPLEMEIIGRTRDDAAGEAFDKSGKMLGLPYPAGPHLDKLAQQGQAKYAFPRPKIDGLDFSFSGLKTSILYFLKKQVAENPDFIAENLADICASIQHTIIDFLMYKLILASKQTGIKQVAIAGGVSANSGLRKALEAAAGAQGWTTFIPRFEYCTDNAAMIGVVGWFKYQSELFTDQGAAPKVRQGE
jgi:N6-L-threonylcarbamoyladenine synthase